MPATKPAHFNLKDVIRPNILALEPYRCARDDYQSGILLDANENGLGHALPSGASIPHSAPVNGSAVAGVGMDSGSTLVEDKLSLHRYPDPGLYGIKEALVKLRGVPDVDHIMLGVGSDEVLDLIQRVAAKPGQQKIAMCPPTYGMYSVLAAVNDLEVVKVPLRVAGGDFGLDTDQVISTLEADPDIRILFLCSPGNPTGTLLSLANIQRILDTPSWNGLVVVDEAYIDFAEEERRMGSRPKDQEVSAVHLLADYKNLIVTQTLSKAFGLAAIRLGICLANPDIIQILNNTKAPYNISVPTAYLSSLALSDEGLKKMRENVRTLISNRKKLVADLQTISRVGEVLGGNEANFVLVQVLDAPRDQGGKPDGASAGAVYKTMAEEKGLVVRNRSKELGCDGCLRITVGTEAENQRCIDLMRQYFA